MLLRQLEYFVALARERHFARAAAACYVSQPALSEAIRKLELELNVTLVRRGHAFEGLTPEGERLAARARRLLADHDALKHEVAAMRTGLTGQLRLGTIPSASTPVARLVAPFCREHPLARVRVDTRLSSLEVLRRVRSFELDAGVIHSDGLDLSGLQVLPLYTEPQVLVATRTLAAGLPDPISWHQAVQLPLCALDTSKRGRQLLNQAMAQADLALAPQVETDSVASLYSLVSTGLWAGILPHPWFKEIPTAAGLQVISIDPPIRLSVALVTHSEPGSAFARALLDGTRTLDLEAHFGGERTA